MSERGGGENGEKPTMLWIYGDGKRRGPLSVEIGRFFYALMTSEALSKNPRYWPGKVVLDVSANNGAIALAIARLVNDDIEQAKAIDEEGDGKTAWAAEPIYYYLNDIAYRERKGLGVIQVGTWTGLGKKALNNRQKIDELTHVQAGGLISKEAAELMARDIDGKKVDILIDRLGATYYTAERGVEAISRLFDAYVHLLARNGVIIVDNYQVVRNVQDAKHSTGSVLQELFADGEQMKQFFRAKGLVLTEDVSGVIRYDLPGLQKPFQDDRAKILLFRMLPNTIPSTSQVEIS